jgi:hypothetical protein
MSQSLWKFPFRLSARRLVHFPVRYEHFSYDVVACGYCRALLSMMDNDDDEDEHGEEDEDDGDDDS